MTTTLQKGDRVMHKACLNEKQPHLVIIKFGPAVGTPGGVDDGEVCAMVRYFDAAFEGPGKPRYMSFLARELVRV